MREPTTWRFMWTLCSLPNKYYLTSRVTVRKKIVIFNTVVLWNKWAQESHFEWFPKENFSRRMMSSFSISYFLTFWSQSNLMRILWVYAAMTWVFLFFHFKCSRTPFFLWFSANLVLYKTLYSVISQKYVCSRKLIIIKRLMIFTLWDLGRNSSTIEI